MQVTVIPLTNGALGEVLQGYERGLEKLKIGGEIETIKTTPLVSSARILRRVIETWGDLLSLRKKEKKKKRTSQIVDFTLPV